MPDAAEPARALRRRESRSALWRLFVDAALLGLPVVVVGSGLRRSALLLPGSELALLPAAEVVEGLGR